jgi:hypothetical protein
MKHLVTKIAYRHSRSAGSFYDMLMIPGTGNLNISFEDTENGAIVTAELSAAINDCIRILDYSLAGDLNLIVSTDDGKNFRMGTDELPVRLNVDRGDRITVSATWISSVY